MRAPRALFILAAVLASAIATPTASAQPPHVFAEVGEFDIVTGDNASHFEPAGGSAADTAEIGGSGCEVGPAEWTMEDGDDLHFTAH